MIRLYTTKEVGRIIDRSQATIHEYRKRGVIQPFKYKGIPVMKNQSFLFDSVEVQKAKLNANEWDKFPNDPTLRKKYEYRNIEAGYSNNPAIRAVIKPSTKITLKKK